MPSRGGHALFDDDGALVLPETTTPTAEDSIAKVYSKDDNRIYLQDGAGAEHEIVEANVEHGEFFVKGNGTPVTITTVNDPVALELGTSNHMADFTFQAGSNGVITDTANNSGTLRITDVGHGLTTGDVVTINGLATPAQNDTTTITKQGNDAFDCDDINFATIDETGTWQMGSYLLVPTGGAGDYRIVFTSSATPEGANKIYVVEIMLLSTAQNDLVTERKFSAADIGAIAIGGLITLSVADRIWVRITGTTDNSDLTLKHFNLSVNRI